MPLFKCQGQIIKSVVVSGGNKIGDVLKVITKPILSIIKFQWYREYEAINGAVNSTYILTGADVGKRIHCIAKLHGHPVDSNWLDSVLTPTCSISGTNLVGSVLFCSYGNTNSEVSYQWYRDDVAISNADQWQYRISKNDVDHRIKCLVTTNGYDKWSNATDIIPIPKVIIKGLMKKGVELTAELVDAVFDNPTYTWYRQGWTLITNDTSYTLQENDVGLTIYCDISDEHGNNIGSGWTSPVEYNWKDWKGSMWDDVGTDYRNESKASFTVPANVICKKIHCQASVYNHTHDNIEQAMATPEIWVNGSLVARGPTHSCGSGGWAFPTVDAVGEWEHDTVIVIKSGGNSFRRGVQADLYGVQHD